MRNKLIHFFLFFWIFFSSTNLVAQTPYSKELKQKYEEKNYFDLYKKTQEILKKSGSLNKAEAHLFQALSTIELYQFDENASFRVLKSLKNFIKKDKEKKLHQTYQKEIEKVIQYLQTASILLQQERRNVAANYMHKTLIYTLENTNFSLGEVPDHLEIKQIASNKKTGIKDIDELIEYAKTKIGIRYHYGGASDRGYDCSGFTMRVFEKINLRIPRTAEEQSRIGQKVEVKKAKPGDLIFFDRNGPPINHVGIVIANTNGELQMIHASTSRGIRIDVIKEGTHWHPHIKMVRRLIF